ncbi:MAG: hypothetical protein IMW89_13320 [Ktedonobacteraceae bacterium]|nr:hypothetical protein [Ktedonobacteraceae bacterium]
MPGQRPVRRPASGAKAIALDTRAILARYRLFLLLSLLGSAGLALMLRIIFAH